MMVMIPRHLITLSVVIPMVIPVKIVHLAIPIQKAQVAWMMVDMALTMIRMVPVMKVMMMMITMVRWMM